MKAQPPQPAAGQAHQQAGGGAEGQLLHRTPQGRRGDAGAHGADQHLQEALAARGQPAVFREMVERQQRQAGQPDGHAAGGALSGMAGQSAGVQLFRRAARRHGAAGRFYQPAVYRMCSVFDGPYGVPVPCGVTQ